MVLDYTSNQIPLVKTLALICLSMTWMHLGQLEDHVSVTPGCVVKVWVYIVIFIMKEVFPSLHHTQLIGLQYTQQPTLIITMRHFPYFLSSAKQNSLHKVMPGNPCILRNSLYPLWDSTHLYSKKVQCKPIFEKRQHSGRTLQTPATHKLLRLDNPPCCCCCRQNSVTSSHLHEASISGGWDALATYRYWIQLPFKQECFTPYNKLVSRHNQYTTSPNLYIIGTLWQVHLLYCLEVD